MEEYRIKLSTRQDREQNWTNNKIKIGRAKTKKQKQDRFAETEVLNQ